MKNEEVLITKLSHFSFAYCQNNFVLIITSKVLLVLGMPQEKVLSL